MKRKNSAYLLFGSVLIVLFSIVTSLQGSENTTEAVAENSDYLAYLSLIRKNSPYVMTVNSNLADGEVLNLFCTNWESCRNAQSSNRNWEGLERGTVGASFLSRFDFVVQRVFYFFDTTSIPNDAQIVKATLFVYVGEYANGNDTVHVVRSMADIPLDTRDFSKFENLSGGSTNPSSTLSWMSVDLDETALDWIVKGGETKLALIHDYDLNNVIPNGENDVLIAMSEDSEHRPYLEVVYMR